jgi:hypothetical protein
VLNDIQRNIDDQIKLQDQMDETRDKYKKAQDAFDRILEWQSVYQKPPSTLPLYTSRHKIKDHVLFDTWKPLLEDIKSIQKAVKNTYKILWNDFDGLVEEFRVEIMPNNNDGTLVELRIAEVEERRDANQ